MSAPTGAPQRAGDARRVTVMGLGLFGGGAGVARWFSERGAEVTVTDLRGRDELATAIESLADLDLRFVLGRHEQSDFCDTELVVANPAVAPGNPFLCAARDHGVRVTSEVELFLESSRARQVWITGTQGKSSTALALAQLLEASGQRARAAGNIGESLLAGLHDEQGTTAVVEVSSYQLEALARGARRDARVELVAVTNVLADHLERHGSVELYARAKARILELLGPGGVALLPAGDQRLSGRLPRGTTLVEHARSAAPNARCLRVSSGRFLDGDVELGRVDDVRLPGDFQIDNLLVALGAAHRLGAPPAALARALPSVTAPPHRLQSLGTFGACSVVDNGVSTTPDSTLAALRSIEGPCTLLVGGRAKRDLPFDELARYAGQRAARVVAFGADRVAIAEPFARERLDVKHFASLEDATAFALAQTAQGGTLLFSPAAASFDAYSNFGQRAQAFRHAIEKARGARRGTS